MSMSLFSVKYRCILLLSSIRMRIYLLPPHWVSQGTSKLAILGVLHISLYHCLSLLSPVSSFSAVPCILLFSSCFSLSSLLPLPCLHFLPSIPPPLFFLFLCLLPSLTTLQFFYSSTLVCPLSPLILPPPRYTNAVGPPQHESMVLHRFHSCNHHKPACCSLLPF